MIKAIGSSADLTAENNEYHCLVADLLGNDIVMSMQNYLHHGSTTCFQHCVNVSYYNYRLCRFLGLNCRAAARAGLLHDLFLYDWHCYKRAEHERLHGFTHGLKALRNAEKYFYITDLEKDIIEKHMWPLTISRVPKYKETVVIVLVDKYCGIAEVLSFRAQVIAHSIRKMRDKLLKKKPA